MIENTTSSDLNDFKVPKPGEWPGAMGAYRMVKPVIKPQIWNILSAAGIGIALVLVLEIIFGVLFKHGLMDIVLNEVVAVVGGAFITAVIVTIYFAAIRRQEISLNEALSSGLKRLGRMVGLLIVVDVVLLFSLLLLIIPFFLVFPRIYIAPYFLLSEDCTVSEALSSSWHKTRGNVGKVYGIFGLNLLIALLFITIVGIPFAIYWGSINAASFALLTLYLSGTTTDTKATKASKEAATVT